MPILGPPLQHVVLNMSPGKETLCFFVALSIFARRSHGKGWGLDLPSLQGALASAKRQGITLRGLVFINPGNPTGNCLTVQDLQQLVRFAYENT